MIEKHECTFKVGKKYRCTAQLSVLGGQAIHVGFEWDPDIPNRLSKKLLREYQQKRDAAIQSLSAQAGLEGQVLVVDA